MAFNSPLAEWYASGVEPPEDDKTIGHKIDDPLPANWLNWQWHRTYAALDELQKNAVHKSDFDQSLKKADAVQFSGLTVTRDADNAFLTVKATGASGHDVVLNMENETMGTDKYRIKQIFNTANDGMGGEGFLFRAVRPSDGRTVDWKLSGNTGDIWTSGRNLNLGTGYSLNLNEGPLYLRSTNGADTNHFIRYFDETSTKNIDGTRIAGNRGVQLGTMDHGATNGGVFHPTVTIANDFYNISLDVRRQPGRQIQADTFIGVPAGVKLGAYIVNYEDSTSSVGAIVANRYANDDTSIFEAVSLFNGWNPMFSVRGRGQVNVFGKTFLHNGAAQNPMNSAPAISVAIGDHDTGFNWNSDGQMEIFANNQVTAWWNTTQFRVEKAFSVGGTKSAFVQTASHGEQLLYAMESPENRFEDFGEGQIGDDGSVVIQMDPIFLETVEIYGDDYQVHVTGIDGNGFTVPVRGADSFTIHGPAGKKFMYRVLAWRLGYHNLRFNYAAG
ncbi:phage minor structural protein, region [Paenibacillus mucilaginosus 3016]|uniref:Phage minor structural protein, region n=1 Tax=Paenibacillus mucilaginosus 3016 TaxID=1116391 RepID=H6NDS7_9BACL|nr:hypothetical protein [Paenibacillus mucilaginosus]AFC32126.1 phage minor structural protein, region [Paenibacillus mucilaginosus 3016]WFA20629.1 hypothetical protein ERY13_27010 [Paenibacillus mucilaginosus]